MLKDKSKQYSMRSANLKHLVQKHLTQKRQKKHDREHAVLMGLVELYLQTGRPVGSQTLKECGFDELSPATLRNYCAHLEEKGFLKQQHSSGGRIPTNLAYKVYAESVKTSAELLSTEQKCLQEHLCKETRQVHLYLQKSIEVLANWSKSAVFLSAPRFDQDFVSEVKLVNLDAHRVLCVLITDFGTIRSEALFTDRKLSSFALRRIEHFFYAKLTGQEKPLLSEDEEKVALSLYNEVMLRHLVDYSHFSSYDIVKTGFSQMLHYPDFAEASSLASGLALFEDDLALHSLLNHACTQQALSFFIGEDLCYASSLAHSCAVLLIPYQIAKTTVGAIGLLCPSRTPYRKHFALLKAAATMIGDSLTKSLHTFKMSYRQPRGEQLDFQRQTILLSSSTQNLLENQQHGAKSS